MDKKLYVRDEVEVNGLSCIPKVFEMLQKNGGMNCDILSITVGEIVVLL